MKRFEEDFLFPNQTEAEAEEAAAYYFNLWNNSPGWWGLPAGQVIQRSHDICDLRKLENMLVLLNCKVHNTPDSAGGGRACWDEVSHHLPHNPRS